MEPRIALIGAGQWGINYIKTFNRMMCTGNLQIVCDENKITLNNIKKVFNPVITTNNLHEILESKEINSVIIATSAITHYGIAKKCLNAGKHVLVEKPMAMSADEAIEITYLAEEKNLILMVGHLMHYHPAFHELKNLILVDNKIGKINYIQSTRMNSGKIRTEENVMWSFAPHDISMILSIVLSPVSEIKAMAGNFKNTNVSDVSMTSIRFDNDIVSYIFVSWLSPIKSHIFTVVGEKGSIVFNESEAESLKLYLNENPIIQNIPYPRNIFPLSNQLRHYMGCIRTGKKPITDGYEGIKVTSVLEKINQEAMKKNNTCNNNRGGIYWGK